MSDIKKLLESLDSISETKPKDNLPAPRNVVAKNAKTAGAGQHKNPREIENTRKEKHKKDFLKDLHEAEKDTRVLRKVQEAYNSFNANYQGVAEAEGQQLSVNQLAMISDEALDNAYGYGRSSPGNTFGWQANLMSAAYAKKMIDAGVTDIEKIADAIHKGWNVTAQKFVQNPDQFEDTEKLRQAGKLDAKLAQRAKLMKIGYFNLDNEEQEKDRVVARALLQAIKGEQGVAEGSDKLQGTPVVSLSDFSDKDTKKDKYGRTVPKKLKKDDPRVKFHKDEKQGMAEGSNPAGVVVKISGREYTAMSPEQKAVKQREWQQLKQQAKKRLQTFTIVDTDKEQGVAEELKMKKQQEFYGKNQRLPDTSTSLAKRSIGWPEVPNVPRTDDGTPTVQHRFHGKGVHTRLDPRPEQTRVLRKDAGKEKPIPSFLQKDMAETSDVSGLLAASKLNNSYIITAELAEGGTKKFRVKAQSERVALEKFKKHYAMAKVIDVTPEVQEATTMPTSPTAPTSATSTTTTSATQQKPLNLQAVQQQLKIPGNPAPGSTSAGSTNPQDLAVQAVIQKAMAGKPLDSTENSLYHSILQKANK